MDKADLHADNENNMFDPLAAVTDASYLYEHRNEASSFADFHLNITDAHCLEALNIKGALREEVPVEFLKNGLKVGGSLRLEVLVYLAKVSNPFMDDSIIEILNIELQKTPPNLSVHYWGAKALIMTRTQKAGLYLRRLVQNEVFDTDPFLQEIKSGVAGLIYN